MEAARLRHRDRRRGVRLLRGLLGRGLARWLGDLGVLGVLGVLGALRSLRALWVLPVAGVLRGLGVLGVLWGRRGGRDRSGGAEAGGSGPIWSKTSTGSSSGAASGSISTAAVSALRAPVAVRNLACGSGCSSPARTCHNGSGIPSGAAGVPYEAKCSTIACASGFLPWRR